MNREVKFHSMSFVIEEDKIYMTKFGPFQAGNEKELSAYGFVDVQVAGRNKNSHMGITKLVKKEL